MWCRQEPSRLRGGTGRAWRGGARHQALATARVCAHAGLHASKGGNKAFGHYRRKKTNKAPRKRTFIANMTKYNQMETATLESAARGARRNSCSEAGGRQLRRNRGLGSRRGGTGAPRQDSARGSTPAGQPCRALQGQRCTGAAGAQQQARAALVTSMGKPYGGRRCMRWPPSITGRAGMLHTRIVRRRGRGAVSRVARALCLWAGTVPARQPLLRGRRRRRLWPDC